MVEVPDTYLKGRKPEDFCAMHVRGDSMYPDFRDGDIVLVLKQNTMNHSGEIGIISYGDDEMTIKRINYVQSEDWLELVPLQSMGKPAAPSADEPLPPRIMRPIIFLCMFAIDLPASFIPLRIAEMDLGLLGLPPDVVMGLPLSFEMCAVGIGILLGSFWSQKKGWRPLLLLGGAAGGARQRRKRPCLGAPCLHPLQRRRGVRLRPHQPRRAGLRRVALLARTPGREPLRARRGPVRRVPVRQRLRRAHRGQPWICVGLPRFGGADGPHRDLPPLHAAPRNVGPESFRFRAHLLRGLGAFFSDIRMAGLLLGNIFPCAFVTVCPGSSSSFPSRLSQAGVSPAGIGRVFLLFCLVIIYLGPFFGKAVDRSPNKLAWLVGGGFLCIGGIIALLLLDGLAAAFVCVALLALCNAVVASAQGTYALEIPVSQRVGSGRTVGIYNITERLGQMLGPVALGQVIALWGVDSGLLGMAAVLAALNTSFSP